ncbi:uncharacterized protein H6S33_008313 [Morchella sextelata]|uniref:uncharacterized protein n=1 Tax=Morchella sextelata TaxID=1174677 RepID=UPI001D03D993|nr:uncharacterized protein H6S33_008313 [Morchella sextelata]KAH0602663.1 hypothetical protein H6S33_008313 [Morchella sextelata]
MVRPTKRKLKAYQSALNLPAGAPGPGSRPPRAPVPVPDDEDAPPPPRRRAPPPRPPPPPPPPPRRTSQRQTKLKQEPQPTQPEPKSATKSATKAATKAAPIRKGRGKGKAKQTQLQPGNDDEDDALVFPSGKSFAVVIDTGPARRKELKRYVPMVMSEDDEDTPRPKRARREDNGKGKAREPIEIDSDYGDDEDEDEAVITSGRKRKDKGKERALVLELDEEEEEDLKEDLAFIAPKRHVLSTRTRNAGSAPKLTPFQKKLKELKAKRAGITITDSESSESPRAALYDTDPSDASGEEIPEEDGEEDEPHYPRADDDLDNESWIISDDEDATALGHPDNQVPIEYTHRSHQPPRENFKVVCLWMVQYLLNPSFPIDDPISQFAIAALDRRLESMGGSVLQSAAWQPEFIRAMRARPDFHSRVCSEGPQRPTCEACHITSRPAAYVVYFTGARYDRETLDDLSPSDAENSEDSAGFEIPAETRDFFVGRYCHERAKLTHMFMHWKKSLRVAMEFALKGLGYFDEKWQNKAAKMSIEERTRWANQVTDDLEPEIKALWYDLKRSLTQAETNMANQERGGFWLK